jgi:hypothetical protein
MGANLIYTVKYSTIGPIFNEVEIIKTTRAKLIRNTQESRYTMEFDVDDILDIFDEGAWDDIGDFIEKINSSDGLEKKELIIEMMNYYGIKFDEPEDLIGLYQSYKGNYSDYVGELIDKVANNLENYSSELEDVPVLVESWI